MAFWKLWDRVSVATHWVSAKGDHEVSGWAMGALLAGAAVGLFAVAWVVLPRRSAGASACTSA